MQIEDSTEQGTTVSRTVASEHLSMPSFTPGPWATKRAMQTGDVAIVTPDRTADDGNPAILAECYEDIRRNREHASDECAANARLIAAAPELYAACESVMAQYVKFRAEYPQVDSESDCIGHVRTALAKVQS